MNPALIGSNRIEETRRTVRVLDIVRMIVVAPRRYLRRDLAEHFEVSERMIQKDMQVIRHGLRLPLAHAPEGYYFKQVPGLPALQYTFSEGLALLLAVQAARQFSGIGSAELAAAVARLEALFPESFTPLLRQAMRQPSGTAHRERREEMLALLNLALLERRKVRVVYETASRGEVGERIVHPFHIFPYVRSWQMVAYCERRREPLIFKVDRIHEATLLSDRYPLPEDFSLDEYMGAAWGLMRGQAGEPEDVQLRFGASAGRWVSEERWHPSQEAEEQPDGSVLFRLHIAITPEFVAWLMYYGDKVEVLAPASLRARLAEAHLRAAEVNR